MRNMNNWLREPLLHFLLLGATLFLAFEWRSGLTVSTDAIIVTPGKVQQLTALFEKTW